ncbi:MAG: hypothetical protein IJT23_05870 [Clostridia bacterium]|nr:hypothetical protein [Clostridia bacterium]
MEHRNRATGWQHAKISGHRNEDLVKELLDSSRDFRQYFLDRVNRSGQTIIQTSVGGLHETSVTSVNGRKTKSKTDLKVYLNNNEIINVSIKKSLSGQVYFVKPELFISTFEYQFSKRIPDSVQRAIKLFWASADDAIDIIKQYADKTNTKNYDLQIRHKSLNATTLKNYNESLYYDMLYWFADHSYELAKLSFSTGAVLNESEWSDFIWYINLLGEHDIDDIFYIDDVCNAAQQVSEEETYFGSNYGGTTIQLPFGFVEWHQGQLQFHHKYDKICKII